jgi:hypothetical protein
LIAELFKHSAFRLPFRRQRIGVMILLNRFMYVQFLKFILYEPGLANVFWRP